MEILIKAAQLILSLSILVLIHELGHFIFARFCGVRVDKFYLFFDPWFALFKYKPKNSDTEYGVGWLPLGGYCKMAGMIDESMDTEQMAQPPQPWEFRSKPASARMLILFGGVLFNFLLALVIFSMILFKWGDVYLPLENMQMGMRYSDTFKEAGFQDGDILLAANGRELKRLSGESFRAILEADTVTVLRDGAPVDISMPSGMMQKVIAGRQGIPHVRYPMIIHDVSPGSPAALAGIRSGDHIISIDGTPTPAYDEVATMLLDGEGNRNVSVGFLRDGVEQSVSLTIDENRRMGVYVTPASQLYQTVSISYGFFSSFPAGIQLGINTLTGYVNDMRYVFTTKEGATSVGGFITIANLFPPTWNWREFWTMTAFISIVLAVMNLLPIPVLDGGHLLFTFYEVVTRRKPSEKFLTGAQVAGMVLLLALLLYANGNDIFRFLLSG